MQDYKRFRGVRMMIRGNHAWAGWIGSFVELRWTPAGMAVVLQLESRISAVARAECLVFDPGHVRRAGDHEIGKGGKP